MHAGPRYGTATFIAKLLLIKISIRFPGKIAFLGETKFASGEWAGIVLDEPVGKNDGSVAGVRYFQCEPKRGVFARVTKLTLGPAGIVQTRYSAFAMNSFNLFLEKNSYIIFCGLGIHDP